jgi:microcystin degradation protein MlrC
VRLAVVGFSHESNTFAPLPADLPAWHRAGVLVGGEIVDVHAGARSTVAGYLAYAAEEPDVTIVPLVYAELTPCGPSTGEAFEFLAGRILAALREDGPWAGVLMPLHGAAVADGCADADRELVARVRAEVGAAVPIGVTLDMHANVSADLVAVADVLTMFQTNPHVDAFEQGLAAARLLGRAIRGDVRPTMALAELPLVVNILRQGTADEPMAGLLHAARAHEQRPGVLAVYLCEGFPYADVPQLGMSVLAITDGDPDLARDTAHAVAGTVWASRSELQGDAPDVVTALHRAHAAARAPVVVLDTGDNVFGGSPGDSTHLLHAARRLGIRGVASLLTDPAAAEHCARAGRGARLSLDVGGRTDDRHGAPFPVAGVVAAVSDGRFEDATPTHGGTRYFDMGTTARLSTDDGFEIVLTSRPLGTVSQEQFRIVGLEPAALSIVIAKGVHSPRAAFEPIAAELVWAASPGCTSADLSTLGYRHRRRPMYPFEPDAAWPRS